MDKRFTVTHGSKYRPVTSTITLNGVISTDPLTRSLAVQAARVACGHRSGVTVWSNDEHGYRLYARCARKLYREPADV